MTFLLFLLIALGWIGWLWAWGRDRAIGGGGPALHMPSLQQPARRGALASPRTAEMARRRRREVLVALALLALTSFVLARAWAPMWAVNIPILLSLVAYAWAVASIERPDLVSARPSFGPVVADAGRPAPGPVRSFDDGESVAVLEFADPELDHLGFDDLADDFADDGVDDPMTVLDVRPDPLLELQSLRPDDTLNDVMAR